MLFYIFAYHLLKELHMLTSDYIMRMIDTLIKVLSRILFLKNGKNFPEALKELDSVTKELLGMDRMFIHSLSDEQLVQLMEKEGNLLAPKCYLLGIVFKEEAEIFKLQGDEESSIEFYMRSLYMFIAGIENSNALIEKNHLDKIDEVIDKLSDYEIPHDIGEKLLYYYEYTGRFDKTENLLYSLINEDSSFIDKGINYYQRLLLKNDSELEKGNLPRNEVEESLADLKSKKNN